MTHPTPASEPPTPGYVDEDGVHWEDYESYVLCGMLELCLCMSQSLAEDILALLGRLYKRSLRGEDWSRSTRLLPGEAEKYSESLLWHLERSDLVEYGTSIRGAWLTGKGAMVCERLKAEGAI